MSQHSILKSFSFAFKGIKLAITERNFRLHLISTVLVVAFGLAVHLSNFEWVIILFCIGLVLSMEIVNTAIEEIVNFISPEHHLKAGRIKDLAAAAVLVASIAVFIIALIIFIPHLSILL
jgi:diacylglycerol kinase